MSSRKEQREQAREERVAQERARRAEAEQRAGNPLFRLDEYSQAAEQVSSALDTPNRAFTLEGFPIVTTDDFPEEGWITVRKKTPTQARLMEEPFVCYTIDGNLAAGQAGDYLMRDSQGYPYPCHKDEFKSSYEVVEDG